MPDGKSMIFVMEDLLYSMPVDADGHPSGPAVKLNDEATGAPTISADPEVILYLSNGKLQLMSAASRAISPAAMNLTWALGKPNSGC